MNKPPVLSERQKLSGYPPKLSSKRIFKIVREYALTDYCQLSLDTGKLVAKAQLQKAQDYYEPLIQQAKEEERKKVLNDIQAGAVSVANLIEKARQETDAISYTQGVLDGEKKVAREIFEEIEHFGNMSKEELEKSQFIIIIPRDCLQSLKDKFLKAIDAKTD